MAVNPRKPRTPAKRKPQSNPAWPQRWVLRMMVKGKPWYYRGLEKFSDRHHYAIEFGTFQCAVDIAAELTSRFKLPARLDVIKVQLLPDRHDNPVPPSSKARLNAAARLYEEFTGHSPEFIDRVSVPDVDTALVIGDCDGVLYSTVRDGKQERYIHEFKHQARPLLCCASDGQSLLLLGGGFQFTDRGIVDD